MKKIYRVEVTSRVLVVAESEEEAKLIGRGQFLMGDPDYISAEELDTVTGSELHDNPYASEGTSTMTVGEHICFLSKKAP